MHMHMSYICCMYNLNVRIVNMDICDFAQLDWEALPTHLHLQEKRCKVGLGDDGVGPVFFSSKYNRVPKSQTKNILYSYLFNV